MQFNFKQTMQETSDAELIKIVTLERDNYQEEAVLAAETELAKRNLTPEQVAAAENINEEQQQIQIRKANTPLDVHWKVLTFIFPAIIQIILSGAFRSEGYDRKARELVKWTLFGFGFYIALILLFSLL
jgi:hypothetical protein